MIQGREFTIPTRGFSDIHDVTARVAEFVAKAYLY